MPFSFLLLWRSEFFVGIMPLPSVANGASGRLHTPIRRHGFEMPESDARTRIERMVLLLLNRLCAERSEQFTGDIPETAFL
jgi:hypothetical protein